MINFLITNRAQSAVTAFNDDVDCIISLVEHESNLPWCGSIPRMVLRMADVFDENEALAPTREHVKSALEFVSLCDDDAKVLVHCEAGISRSPAMVMILLMFIHKDIKKVEEIMRVVRPNCSPNDLILKFGDEILGTGRQLQDLGDILGSDVILPWLKKGK